MNLPYKSEEYKIDRVAFEQVVKELESGAIRLNFVMIGAIFGQPFWELLTICLIDAKVAHSQLEGK